jgi:hypothetical protein
VDLLAQLTDLYVDEDVEPLHDINQEDLLACVANAAAFSIAVQMMLDLEDDEPFFPSRLYLHWVARGCLCGQDSRISISAMVQGVHRHGIIAEGDWVYNTARRNAPPAQPTLLPRIMQCESVQPEDIKYIVLGRQCVLAGLAVFDNLSYIRAEVPAPQGTYRGHTTVVIYGFDDAAQVFIVKATYGSRYGDNGSFYVPYSFLTTTAFMWGQQRPLLGDLLVVSIAQKN